jgi:hypothetical protein
LALRIGQQDAKLPMLGWIVALAEEIGREVLPCRRKEDELDEGELEATVESPRLVLSSPFLSSPRILKGPPR